MKKLFYILVMGLIAISCSDDEFAPAGIKENFSTGSIQSFTNQSCGGFTLIKPKVDILIVWDNSSSTLFINSQTITALQQTVNEISDQFDFHILLAPLIDPDSQSPTLFLMADNPTGLNSQALGYLIGTDQSDSITAFSQLQISGGSYENGIQRSIDLINANMSNGIFRSDSHVLSVIMSNQDDNSWIEGAGGFPSEIERTNYLNSKQNDFRTIYNSLNSLQMRFMSITPYSLCQSGWGPTYFTYLDFSERVYHDPQLHQITPNDQNFSKPDCPTGPGGMANPYSCSDSYNLCSTAFSSIFDGPNNSIQQQVIHHVYDHWPIATTQAPTFDPGTIEVEKVLENGTKLTIPQGGANGFDYIGLQNNKDTRILPTPGEPFTGHMIKLNGNSMVTHPECLIIKTQAPADYFGFIALTKEPDLETVTLTINGNEIPQSSSNGWESIGFFQSKSVTIIGPGNYNPPNPPLLKTGYFLKLNGNAVYTNNSAVTVNYVPKVQD